MHLQLITLSGVRVDDEAYELIAPTAAGEIAVFPGHEPIVTLVVPGTLAVRHKKSDPDKDLQFYAISGGILEINPKFIRLLVDEADHGEDIIEAESRAALDRAIAMRDQAHNQVDLDKARELIDRHQVRLRVADLHHHRHRRL